MVFFNFLNLFAIFLEFSITRRVGMNRNDNFYFLSFSAFSNLFRLEINPYGYLLLLRILCYFFWNFQLWVGGVGPNRNNSFRSIPTRLLIKNSKKIVNKFKKLKNTIMASFQSKIRMRRVRKRENKNYCSDPFLPDP